MERPYYIFYLIDPASGNYWYVGSTGLVTQTGVKKPISAPISWDETEIKWKRSDTYLGIIRSLTTPYQFVEDGAKILRYLYYWQGIEAPCTLKVEILNLDGGTWEYVDFVSFGLDFSTFIDGEIVNDILKPVVKINAIEDGIYKYLRVNEKTPYELEILDSDSTPVFLDGVTLEAGYDFAPIGGTANNPSAQVMISNAFYSLDGAYDVGTAQNQIQSFINVGGGAIIPSLTENYAYEALIDQSVNFSMRQEITVLNDGSSSADITAFKVILVIADPPPNSSTSATIVTNQVVYTETFSPVIGPGQSKTFTIDFQYLPLLTLLKDQRVYILFDTDSIGSSLTQSISWSDNPGSQTIFKHRIHAVFNRPPSYARGYRYYQFFYKLVDLVTEGNYQGDSQYLSNPSANDVDLIPWRLVMTCADALRMLPGPKIKTTLSDMVKDAAYSMQLGLGVNSANKIIMEPLTKFFDKNNFIAHLGDIVITTEPATEFIFNTVKVGYPDISYDEINGRNEVNASQTDKLPITRKVEQADWVGPYRYDPYGVEYARENIVNKKTVDTGSDNDVFGLCVSGSTTVFDGVFCKELDRTGAATITGVPYPLSLFNVPMSPRRKLLRNRGRLATALYRRQPTEFIKFQTGDKNTALVSNLGSGVIGENSNIQISTLGDPLFHPIWFYFETEVPHNIPQLMATNPNGYFTGNYKGVTWKFFLWEVALKPAKNATYRWQCISHPDNDETLLID